MEKPQLLALTVVFCVVFVMLMGGFKRRPKANPFDAKKWLEANRRDSQKVEDAKAIGDKPDDQLPIVSFDPFNEACRRSPVLLTIAGGLEYRGRRMVWLTYGEDDMRVFAIGQRKNQYGLKRKEDAKLVRDYRSLHVHASARPNRVRRR